MISLFSSVVVPEKGVGAYRQVYLEGIHQQVQVYLRIAAMWKRRIVSSKLKLIKILLLSFSIENQSTRSRMNCKSNRLLE